jgi:hypothetical protein
MSLETGDDLTMMKERMERSELGKQADDDLYIVEILGCDSLPMQMSYAVCSGRQWHVRYFILTNGAKSLPELSSPNTDEENGSMHHS